MAENGVRSTNLPQAPLLDDVMGNRDGTSSRQSITSLGAQLAGSGAVKAAIDQVRSQVTGGLISVSLWSQLQALPGPYSRAGAEVPDSDTGTHPNASPTGYDNTDVPNAGRYSWISDWNRWAWIGPTGLTGKAEQSSLDALAASLGDLATKDTVNLTDVEDRAINHAKMSDVPELTFTGRRSASSGPRQNLTKADAMFILGVDEEVTASTRMATTAFVMAALSDLVASSPDALDTLNELAAALGDDPNFAATVNAAIGDRLRKDQNLSDLVNAAAARANLGLGSAATVEAGNFSSVNQAPVRLRGVAGGPAAFTATDAVTNDWADGSLFGIYFPTALDAGATIKVGDRAAIALMDRVGNPIAADDVQSDVLTLWQYDGWLNSLRLQSTPYRYEIAVDHMFATAAQRLTDETVSDEIDGAATAYTARDPHPTNRLNRDNALFVFRVPATNAERPTLTITNSDDTARAARQIRSEKGEFLEAGELQENTLHLLCFNPDNISFEIVGDLTAGVREDLSVLKDEVADISATGALLDYLDGPQPPAASFVDADGRVIAGYDEMAQPVVPWVNALRGQGDAPDYATINEEGQVVGGYYADGSIYDGYWMQGLRKTWIGAAGPVRVDPEGRMIEEILPVDKRELPVRETDSGPGGMYLEYGKIRIGREYDYTFRSHPDDTADSTAELIAFFEDLRAEHPDYITRTSLGQDDDDTDIWRYDFVPPNLVTDPSLPLDLPRIVLVNGVHGFERNGMRPIIQLAREMCHRWREDRLLERLRWETHVIMVPCMHPYSMDNNVRKSRNDVDVNRNFDAGWADADSTDPDSMFYKGTSPASEIETQIMSAFLDVEAPLAEGVIGMHNHGDFESRGKINWIGVNKPELQQAFAKAMREHGSWFRREIPQYENHPGPINQVIPLNAATMDSYTEEAGGRGVLFESTSNWTNATFVNKARVNYRAFRKIIEAILDTPRTT